MSISKEMRYSSGYKYQTNSNIIIQTILRPAQSCLIDGYVFLGIDGILHIYRSYAWDGCTNAPDTDSNLLSGLVHDALYQLMQVGVLDKSFKSDADNMLRDIMISQGSSRIIAAIFHAAVDIFGSLHMKPNKVRTLQIR
jgi:hypothetical protein